MTQKRLGRIEARIMLKNGFRKCVTCKEVKPLDKFYKNAYRHGGYAYDCKMCSNKRFKKYRQKDYVKKAQYKRAKKYRIKNKEKLLNIRYLKQYNISADRKREMLKQQNFQCKICKRKINMISGHIDHCHKSNKVRGILCGNCNTAIGLFKENTNIIKRSIKYLNVQNASLLRRPSWKK